MCCILTRDESPLVYRAPVASEDSNFDCSTALVHVTMYKQFARKAGTSANSALIRTASVSRVNNTSNCRLIAIVNAALVLQTVYRYVVWFTSDKGYR